MTTQYETPHPDTLYPSVFGVPAPEPAIGRQVWPRQPGVFIRLDEAGQRVLERGQFGLVPPWVKSASDAKLRSTKLVNARHETASTSNNFRDAWLGAQRCIVPLQAFVVDDFRSGKAVPTRIARPDGAALGAAGLWQRWVGKGAEEGTQIVSFCLLTVNANSHALLHRYGPPGSEKRMPVLLGDGAWNAWLSAPSPDKAREFMRAYAADWLTANPVQKGSAR